MSDIDRDTVRKIAQLARIRVPEDRLDGLAGELNNILDWVEQLGEVNTDEVEPMTSPVNAELVWRDDIVTDGGKAADVLKNAPASDYGFFAVPKVIE
ncbi:Asp-tRNA(Asn)/Glu-tRNA(Gln) amidotransferase subunit GatC [Yunchengibacter salinarum]|uniref:Asp-tRNA(Asn)/Glu-tRNA(Gln) amidotransferase subunit GatC n=1 Tax=Yunchengibacter salinarum TaxID=3133399 RepID=UPI0035B589F7